MIKEGWASLHELETTWSLDDVLAANALLDYQSDAEAIARMEQEPRNPRRGR